MESSRVSFFSPAHNLCASTSTRALLVVSAGPFIHSFACCMQHHPFPQLRLSVNLTGTLTSVINGTLYVLVLVRSKQGTLTTTRGR